MNISAAPQCMSCDGVIFADGGPVPANIESLFPSDDFSTWNLAPLSPISVRWTQSFPVCSNVTGGCGFSWVDKPTEASAYVQDNWAVSSNLTLNLGLRWDLALNWAGQEYDYPPLRTKSGQEWTNFGPRLGSTWHVRDDTAVGIGYGVIWIEQTGITTPFTTPVFGSKVPLSMAALTPSVGLFRQIAVPVTVLLPSNSSSRNVTPSLPHWPEMGSAEVAADGAPRAPRPPCPARSRR